MKRKAEHQLCPEDDVVSDLEDGVGEEEAAERNSEFQEGQPESLEKIPASAPDASDIDKSVAVEAVISSEHGTGRLDSKKPLVVNTEKGNDESSESKSFGTGFSASSKVNPFVCSINSSSSFLNRGTGAATGGGGDALRVSIPGDSPKTPRSNPFAAISPSHNPFVTVVPGNDEAFKAVASAAASPASITSTVANATGSGTSVGVAPPPAGNFFNFQPPKAAVAGPSGFAMMASQVGPGLAFGGGGAPTIGVSKFTFPTSSSAAPSSTAAFGAQTAAATEDDAGGGDDSDDPEEDLTPASFGKTYQLTGKSSGTGEENEDCLIQVRAKLYRMVTAASGSSSSPSPENKGGGGNDGGKDNDVHAGTSGANVGSSGMPGEWLEVGVGPVRLLKTRPSDASAEGAPPKVRVVMRREEKRGGHGTKVLLNMAIKSYTKAVKQSDKLFNLTSLVSYTDGADVVSCTYLLKFKQASESESLLSKISASIASQ